MAKYAVNAAGSDASVAPISMQGNHHRHQPPRMRIIICFTTGALRHSRAAWNSHENGHHSMSFDYRMSGRGLISCTVQIMCNAGLFATATDGGYAP